MTTALHGDRPGHVALRAAVRDGVPRARPHLRLLRHEPDVEAPTAEPPPPVPPPPVPDDLRGTAALHRRAGQVLSLVLEVLDGRRPHSHLTAHLDRAALRYVRAATGRRARAPSRLTSVHLSRPCPDAVEVAAVHRVGGRARALAARFEGHPDEPSRWRCVTVRMI